MSQILSQNLCEFNPTGATDVGGGRHTQVPPLLVASLAHREIQHNMYQHETTHSSQCFHFLRSVDSKVRNSSVFSRHGLEFPCVNILKYL